MMKKQIFMGLAILLCMASLSLASDDDLEYRANTSFSFDLNELWKLKVAAEFHFLDGEHFEQQNEVLFTYKGLSDWVDLGVGYKPIYKKDSSNEWRLENRPLIEATFKKNLLGMK